MTTTLQWFPLLPTGFVLFLGAALLAVLAFGSWLLTRKSVPRRWVLALGAIRVGMIIVFIFGLLRPVLSFPRSVALTPDVLILVDASRSMSRPSTSGSETRLDEVRRALRESPAVQKAAQTHTLHWFSFDERAYPLTAEAVDRVQPRGDSTDIAGSLSSALRHVQLQRAASGSQGSGTRVLLVSDGQDQGAGDVIAAARELGVVVDVLAPARGEGKALSAAVIADVQCARRVLLGSETALLATIRADGGTEGLALVIEEGGREIHRREIGTLPAGEESRIELADHPAEPGLKRYTLRLMQGGEKVGAARAVNVQVSDKRSDVLILEDTWRWEFKFLRRLLEDDPSFNLTAFLSRGGGAFVQFGEPERRVKLGGFPHSRRELDGFDTFLLGDLNPQTWPRGLARHIHDAVTDGGKSLVVLAGPHLGEWINVGELARLLPVELTRQSGTPVSGRIDLRVTPEGESSNWFSLSPGSASGGREPPGVSSATDSPDASFTPTHLPPVEQVYPVLRKRPAATVLLEATNHSNAYGPLVVMAEHTVGRGRVLFIGTDTLWRWQTLGPRSDAGVTLYGAFWQHALRALAPAEPTSSANQLWLRPERTLYRTGDRVRVTVEWRSEGPEAAIAGSVVLPDGNRLPLDLVRDPRDARRLAAQFDVTEPGRYRIEADARLDAQPLADMATFVEVVPRPGEDDALPVDMGLLGRLASATGGRIIDPTAPDGWLPDAPETNTVIIKRQSLDLWHNFAVLLTLCVLLAADWTLRLFRGYV